MYALCHHKKCLSRDVCLVLERADLTLRKALQSYGIIQLWPYIVMVLHGYGPRDVCLVLERAALTLRKAFAKMVRLRP